MADITPIINSGPSKIPYDIKDFNPIINNISPISEDNCKLDFCGDSYNWSVRTYAPKDNGFTIIIKVTKFKTHEKAQRNFDNYVSAIRKERFDKLITKDSYSIFISSVKKLRWDFPPTPTGTYASRVIFLKNNIMLEVHETSRSKQGEHKNPFLAGLGGQLRAVTK